MEILTEKLRAPALQVDGWLNSPPLALSDLRGQVVLIDFWDYTCMNCLHTLPYLQEWHRRYAAAGLVLIGIHAPEFDFAHAPDRVAQAVQALGLEYPVAQDNDFKTWHGFANRAWPAKYLIDGKGYIRAIHHGEGAYAEMEQLIQTVLQEQNPHPEFPEIMPPLRTMDQPGAACYRPTPELYLGFARGRVGNIEGNSPNQIVQYISPMADGLPDTVYLEGAWLNAKEFIEAQPSVETDTVLKAKIHVNYQAAEVNCVLGSALETPIIVSVWLDGQPVPPADRGEDVIEMDGQTVVLVNAYRMVKLLAHADFERHRLSLHVDQSGLRAYAFTFAGCSVFDGQ